MILAIGFFKQAPSGTYIATQLNQDEDIFGNPTDHLLKAALKFIDFPPKDWRRPRERFTSRT